MGALDLFGGRETVDSRLHGYVRRQLAGMRGRDTEALAHRLGLPENTFYEVLAGQKRVDWGLYQILEGPLEMSFIASLGRPAFSADSPNREADWERMQGENPAVGSGPISLGMYISLCLREELARSTRDRSTA